MPKIWIDADAVPKKIKEILLKTAEHRFVPMTFVANYAVDIPRWKWVQRHVVDSGFDKADDWIVEQCQENDLVITADVPLAARVIEKGAEAITPRGRSLDKESIKESLSFRNFSEDLRNSGVQTGGPPPLSPKNVQQFSNILHTWVQKHHPKTK